MEIAVIFFKDEDKYHSGSHLQLLSKSCHSHTKRSFSPLKKQGNWDGLTFVKTSGTDTRDGKKIGQ